MTHKQNTADHQPVTQKKTKTCCIEPFESHLITKTKPRTNTQLYIHNKNAQNIKHTTQVPSSTLNHLYRRDIQVTQSAYDKHSLL